jgi:carbonic anhydrase
VFSNLPREEDDTYTTPEIDLNGTLPTDRTTFRYSGSLTTPPCTEGFQWSVLREAIQLSQEQIDAFDDVFDFDNNRPVQPLGTRSITIVK